MILFPVSSLTLFMGEFKSFLTCYVILYLFLLFSLGFIQRLYLFLTSPPTEKPSLPMTEQPGWALIPLSGIKCPTPNSYRKLCCRCSFVFPPRQGQCLAHVEAQQISADWMNQNWLRADLRFWAPELPGSLIKIMNAWALSLKILIQ